MRQFIPDYGTWTDLQLCLNSITREPTGKGIILLLRQWNTQMMDERALNLGQLEYIESHRKCARDFPFLPKAPNFRALFVFIVSVGFSPACRDAPLVINCSCDSRHPPSRYQSSRLTVWRGTYLFPTMNLFLILWYRWVHYLKRKRLLIIHNSKVGLRHSTFPLEWQIIPNF